MSEYDAPFHCYPCARGDHDEHKMNAWEPDIPCECPPCAIPYRRLLDARPLPIHRTEAGYPNCSTCDGGGCPDCTDPA